MNYGEFIDIYGVLPDGSTESIGGEVEYFSQNESVATVFEGSVRAEGEGTTQIIVSYDDLLTVINVTVNSTIDLEAFEAEVLAKYGVSTTSDDNFNSMLDEPAVYASGGRTVQQILDKAVAMKNVAWTPTETINGWNGRITFVKGTKCTGIPYSQRTQCDEITFLSHMAAGGDFYKNTKFDYNGASIYCPKYGVDCSGFVTYALGLKMPPLRYNTDSFLIELNSNSNEIQKVGGYNVDSPDETEYKNAYKQMTAGDAVVKSGHAMLIVDNDPVGEQIVVYHTENTVPIVSVYSHATLWNKDNPYRPFRIK